ncbi:cyclin-like protein [Sarocladium strictum]
MASGLDSYRPAREGYQPPVVTGGAAKPDRPSRSPPRRRDFPPTVPTPPQASSRTSPPRSSTRSGQQSRAVSRDRSPLPGLSQWFFTTEEVQSTPSIVEGVPPSEERLRRAKGVNFIYQAGVMLDLPQITLWVAGVLFHRFYMRYSMEPSKGGIHHYNISATALFLANKVEENCRKTKDIIIAVAKVAQKNTKLVIDEQDKEYWRWRDTILTYEELMLEQLTFDLMIDNPYRHLFELLGQLDIVHNKHLRQSAWAFCNDACLTAIPLLIESRDVAISAIYFASVHTNQQIDDVRGDPWWVYLKGDEGRCAKAIELMREFYTENPLKKQNPSLPSPAYTLDVTRRRGETSQSQTDTPGAATPMDVSPGRTNGNADVTPAKRESEADNGDRSDKRQRMSEGEEGELMEE